ncbi:MAG TPA: phosphoribosylaminoimidazolesuccinocarboxamide synthase, partial [Candidatus Marinimicrobia bacterium]|nr:phosphoribosylaminoimidazolesuccinocarboxamide synthase [Candidatus Neomarinimicrobiota bacterium]
MTDYTKIIAADLGNCLTETKLSNGKKYRGKVRDSYELEDRLILITTDRQSAFDRILAAIPFKGQVLNQTSAWWFEQTKEIISNHVINVPDPNVTVAKKCTVFPIEFVVRGYITGSTSTSLWTVYNSGDREYCGNVLPDG